VHKLDNKMRLPRWRFDYDSLDSCSDDDCWEHDINFVEL
jgi:hypothetical protein